MSAMPAMTQGRLLERRSRPPAPRSSPGARPTAAAPTGEPHEWQYFAPAVRGVLQVAHVAPAKGAPQLEQNRPAASAPQLGQRLRADSESGGWVMVQI
ncbi:MAG TPA: hypothetical protein VEI06_01650 [Gemmatimonadaceae bacterium]|nr:hypothetical protein [Gemmatimonadaceae bacterium]